MYKLEFEKVENQNRFLLTTENVTLREFIKEFELSPESTNGKPLDFFKPDDSIFKYGIKINTGFMLCVFEDSNGVICSIYHLNKNAEILNHDETMIYLEMQKSKEDNEKMVDKIGRFVKIKVQQTKKSCITFAYVCVDKIIYVEDIERHRVIYLIDGSELTTMIALVDLIKLISEV